MIHFGFVALVPVGVGRTTPAADPQASLKRLDALIRQDAEEESLESLTTLQREAVDAGPAALQLLSRLLRSTAPSRRYRAAYALAFGAQLESLDLLVDQFKRSKDQGIKSLACFALARRGSESDVRFLVGALKGEHFGDEWRPIEVAALSLGVLRVGAAVAPLQVTAAKTPGSIASAAAEEALGWIRHGPYRMSSILAEGDLRPVLAIMRHGIPRISESAVFHEPRARRLWKRKERTWLLQSSATSQVTPPSIYFDTFISTDGERAVVAVGLHFGPLDGVGYDYLLRSHGGSWEVIGILPTWIS